MEEKPIYYLINLKIENMILYIVNFYSEIQVIAITSWPIDISVYLSQSSNHYLCH